MSGFFETERKILTKHTSKGGVPGGHEVICDKGKPPFVPPMKECHSIQLRCSDVVVDIGAYCGTYALRAARFPAKKVIAFEPTEGTFRVLKKNAGSLPNLEIRRVAVVGDDRKSVRLFVSSGIGVTNSLIDKKKSTHEDVPAERYEDVVRGASVVKIDVEGAEYDYDVVQPGIRALIIDFHPVVGIDWLAKSEAIIASIKAAGFSTVIEPDFSNGWTRAGSWIREVETSGCCEELLGGIRCCGCGTAIRGRGKSLCPVCWDAWSTKDRQLFSLAKVI